MDESFFANQTAYMTAFTMAMMVGLGIALIHIASILGRNTEPHMRVIFNITGVLMLAFSLFGAYMFVTRDESETFFVAFWGLMGLVTYAIPVGLIKIGIDIGRAISRRATSTTFASSPSRG